jgi:hypothetical protein
VRNDTGLENTFLLVILSIKKPLVQDQLHALHVTTPEILFRGEKMYLGFVEQCAVLQRLHKFQAPFGHLEYELSDSGQRELAYYLCDGSEVCPSFLFSPPLHISLQHTHPLNSRPNSDFSLSAIQSSRFAQMSPSHQLLISRIGRTGGQWTRRLRQLHKLTPSDLKLDIEIGRFPNFGVRSDSMVLRFAPR